jgi:hypothetical protein
MLIIEPNYHDSFKKVLAEALKDGSFNELLEKLHYLHRYGDEDGTGRKSRVILMPSSREQYFDIFWKKPVPSPAPATWGGEWETWMNGGLVYRETSDRGQKWSVHT